MSGQILDMTHSSVNPKFQLRSDDVQTAQPHNPSCYKTVTIDQHLEKLCFLRILY